ncbi:MAG: hypothetical protein GX956_06240 [Firmicutes bacterium]|nr:hypothetical protein [Bacillota bacterium]
MGELWKRLGERQRRVFGWLALATILGIAILIMQPQSPQATQLPLTKAGEEATISSSLESHWEGELTSLINNLLGTKGNQVFLTLERRSKLVIAHNSTIEERKTTDGSQELRKTTTPVILRNDGERKESPLILEELEPIVRGVVVVLDHQSDTQLRLQVAQAIATVLQVPMYRIEVLFKQ